ncbi:MAG: histidine phosphatase family protein, partial [Prevotella sp.]|nr:histidine phosphatase family protein [Prevotella sp.]
RIYVLRHGQSEANLQVAHAGWSHVPLTEKGLAQARAAAARMHEVHYDKVIVSDLHRAIQTAQCALPDYTYEMDWRIRELGVGNLEGRKVADCLREMGDGRTANPLARNPVDAEGNFRAIQ